uniref:Uncharacterized protein n=1 Tax=Gouania willdenowi TaxID=441366 RepID=A0A8C5DGK3_GOUWI
MSIPSRFQGLGVNLQPRENNGHKSQMQFAHSGDDNANQLSTNSDQKEQSMFEDNGYNTTCIPPLVSQTESPGKIVIWGSEQQCVERGFGDCQEIHTFLRSRTLEDNEDEDDAGSIGEGKDESPMSISSSSTASSASVGVRRDNNDGNRVQSRIQRGREAQRNMTCHSTEELDTCLTGQMESTDTRQGRDRYRAGLKESKSETNVFVSSLSAATLSGSLSSALDGNGKAFVSQSMYKTNQYPSVNNTTSVQTRQRAAPADAVQNSPLMHPQETQEYPLYSSQDWTQDEGGHFRNGQSSKDGLGHRRKAGFEERVLPRRQQLVRPLCQTEMGRARSLPESNSPQTGIAQPTSVTHNQALHSNGSNRKFTKSSLREPSDFSHLYNTSVASQLRQPNPVYQREAPHVENQPAATAECSSSPPKPSTLEKRPQTQLTYRRNCSSPNRSGIDSRSSTPPHSPLRTPQDSPRRQPTMYLISRNVSGVARHIPTGCNPAIPTSAQGYGNSCLRAPIKTNISTSGIPKAPLNNQRSSTISSHSSPKESTPSPKLKPKGVRPKIITSVRKNPQFKPQAAEGPYQVSSLPSRLSTYSQSKTASTLKDSRKEPSKTDAETSGSPVLSASNLLYDKYRQEMQNNSFPSGMLIRTIRAPGHMTSAPPAHAHSHTAPPKLGSKGENFYEDPSEAARQISFKNASCEDAQQSRAAAPHPGGSGSLLRTGRGLRLGLGAVTRTATGSANGKGPSQGQKSHVVFSQPVQPVIPAPSQKSQEKKDDQVVTQHPSAAPPATSAGSQSQSTVPRSLLPKSSQSSGLRPPSFCSTRIPAGRLAAFGFVRSSSVSSAQSADSAQSDPCRTTQRVGVNEEAPLHRVTAQIVSTDQQRGAPCRSNSLQPPSTPALPRRFLPPQPRSSPGVGRKEFQRSSDVTRSLPSSPKRLAVVPPKPQSPVQSAQRPAAAVRGSASTGSPPHVPPLKLQQENLQREKEEAQQREQERQAEERGKREEVRNLQRAATARSSHPTM